MDCSIEALAKRNGFYYRNTDDLRAQLQIKNRLAEKYLELVPPEELSLITDTHRLYFEPRLRLDVKGLENTKTRFFQQMHAFELQQKDNASFDNSVWRAQVSAHGKLIDYLIKTGKQSANRLPVFLKYQGAFTGRFTGGEGFNIQGLARPQETRMSIFNEVDTAIRSAICAPAYHHLLSVDANAMEPRITAWLTGSHWLEGIFAYGQDLYMEFIRGMFQAIDTTLQARIMRDGAQDVRKIAKLMFLSVQYGAGAYRLFQTLQKQLGADKMKQFFGEEKQQRLFCLRALRWAQKRAADVENWKRILFNAFLDVANRKQSWKVGLIELHPGGSNSVEITLPSGRKLVYPAVTVNEHAHVRTTVITDSGNVEEARFLTHEITYTNQGKRTTLYQDKLFENIVQAIGRDVLASMILYAKQNSVQIVCHIHDELIAVIQNGLLSKHEIWGDGKAILPQWAEGLTLSLSTKTGINFSQI